MHPGLLSVLCILVLGPHLLGQAPRDGTVAGQGSAELKMQPQLLRVQVEILAKANDLQTALAKLKERRDAARLQLKALAAVPESVAFGEPTVAPEKTDQQKQMEAMVAQRMRNTPGARPPQKKTEAPPAVVLALLRFDLPLKAADGDQLLMVAQALQQRVKDADLGGLQEFDKLSPQDEELAEEARAMMGYQQPEQHKRGEPTFLYVAKLSAAELDKAMAEAFQSCRHQADRLARAAGAQLGRLHHLDTQPVTATGEDTAMMYYGRYPGTRPVPAALPSEATATQAGPVTYRVALNATFSLKTQE